MALLLFPLAALWLLVRAAPLPARVSWWRRVALSVVLAVCTVVPALPTLVVPATVFRGAVVTYRVDEDGGEKPVDNARSYAIDGAIALLAWWLVLVHALGFVRLGGKHRVFAGTSELGDRELRDHILQLAGRLGCPVPVLLQRRTPHGLAIAAAAVDGAVPIVVLDEGVLHRLAPSRRDAIVAHELGHLAARCGRWRVGTAVAVGVAAVFASGVLHVGVAMCWLMALRAVAFAIRSQRDEFLADRAAARLVGNEVMTAALAQTHAANYQSAASPWCYGLLSHPHLAERRARLGAADALGRRAARARRATQVIVALALLASLWLGSREHSFLAASIAVSIAVLPLALLASLQPWPQLRDATRLGMEFPSRVTRWRIASLLVGVALLFVGTLARGQVSAGLLFSGVLGVAAAPFWGHREVRLRRRLGSLAATRDWPTWVKVYERASVRLRHRPDLWLRATDVYWFRGDRDRSHAESDGLLRRWPHFHLARISAIARLRISDPDRAVELARDLLARVPGNPIVELTLASSLRKAGAHREARHIMDSALGKRPANGVFHAASCRIETARLDIPAARNALAEAKRLAPGDLLVVVAEAELAVVEQRSDAEALVSVARDRALLEPERYLGAEVESLVAKVASG